MKNRVLLAATLVVGVSVIAWGFTFGWTPWRGGPSQAERACQNNPSYAPAMHDQCLQDYRAYHPFQKYLASCRAHGIERRCLESIARRGGLPR